MSTWWLTTPAFDVEAFTKHPGTTYRLLGKAFAAPAHPFRVFLRASPHRGANASAHPSGTPNRKSWPCGGAQIRTDSLPASEIVAVRYCHRRHERPEEVSPVLTTVGWVLPSMVARRST